MNSSAWSPRISTQFNGLTTNDPTGNGNAADPTGATDGTTNRYDSLSLSGNIGGAFVSAAWQKRTDAYKTWTVGGTLPVAEGLTLMANYINSKPEGGDSLGSYAVGGKYTIVSGTDAILQYARNDADGDAKRTLVNLTLTHALSKRTTLYGTAARGKNVGSALGNFNNDYAGRDNSSYGVGVAHSF